jgi:hypothetical protein
LEEGVCLAGTRSCCATSYLTVHLGGGTQQLVCVQGFLHWAKEEEGRIDSVDRASRKEGCTSLGAFFLELAWQAYVKL